MMQSDRSILVVIDFQTRLVTHMDSAIEIVANAKRIIAAANLMDVPVVVTEQNAKGLGPTVPELNVTKLPTVAKLSFGSCATPEFMSAIGSGRDLILIGCEAHICVLQTALGLQEHGHRVFVVQDACGSRRAESKQAALRRLAQRGVDIVTTEMVVFEWMRTSAHPKFKAISALIK
jgi:nicotinamidase-related amidase